MSLFCEDFMLLHSMAPVVVLVVAMVLALWIKFTVPYFASFNPWLLKMDKKRTQF